MYYEGEGVERSYERAFEYEQAADLGFARGQYVLGLLYATGHGVERDRAGPIKLWVHQRLKDLRLQKTPEDNEKSNEKEHDKERNNE